MKITIGSRDSKLAVVQAEMVIAFLRGAHPGSDVQLATFKTTGDKILDRRLDEVGGKGLFVKELDAALRAGTCDYTVHSCKDLPMEVPDDLPLVCFSAREDPRDVLVFPEGADEPDWSLPIGTSSRRRELQLRALLAQWDGIVIGISAGTMNSAETVYAQPELPGESVDPQYERFLPGLGLTETMILPHYQMVKDDLLDGRRLYEDITYPDSWGQQFLVLPDGSYLLIEDGHETVYGEAWRLSNGCLHRICDTDQSVLWR